MKHLILSASLIVLSAAALAPAAFARQQASTPSSLSENATITDLVQYNRDVRNKK
ncbi:MAG: hypothetical protein WBA76_13415 [Phormidesmis sp.]